MTKTTLLLLAALSMTAACRRSERPAAPSAELPAVPVETAAVTAGAHQTFQEVAGTVEAKLRASIEAKTTGRIDAMPVRLGQKVQKGEQLVQLDAREIQARLEQAAATREQAETDLQRLSALLQKQALTQAEFDAARARFRVADAALREAQTQLAHAAVLAPFDGVIVRKMADIGDLAAPGRTLLEMEDPSALRFVAHVPEALLGAIRAGMEIPVRFGDSQVAAKVAEIAPAGDPATRTSRVELDLPGTDVRAGSFGRLLVPSGDRPILAAPKSALVLRGQLELMFVVSSNRAELRLVRTGKRLGEAVEILSGLAAGEMVAVENAAALRDGQPVTLR